MRARARVLSDEEDREREEKWELFMPAQARSELLALTRGPTGESFCGICGLRGRCACGFGIVYEAAVCAGGLMGDGFPARAGGLMWEGGGSLRRGLGIMWVLCRVLINLYFIARYEARTWRDARFCFVGEPGFGFDVFHWKTVS